MPREIKARAKERLERVLDSILDIRLSSFDSPEFAKWHRDAKVAIANTFGESSRQVNEFENILFRPQFTIVRESEIVSRNFANLPAFQKAYSDGLGKAAAVLQSMIGEIEEYWDEDSSMPESPESPETTDQAILNRVFIIHGRDHGITNTVARFLDSLGINTVILQEQPDQGRTIIEKFEEYAQEVDLAIALFTPDDVGGLDDGNSGLRHRVRQNVIFEFGYFTAKLGRNKTLALVKGNPEILSDYSGVLYTALDDSDGWKMRLVRELKSAGFDIDANRIL